jgi:uncharacterized protein (DUF1697 family)
MQTYISILRGINVGGSKIIKMDALRKMYEDMNFKNIETYIQSGNVIFQNRTTDCETLELKINKKIKDIFSFDIPVIVKTQSEMKIIFLNNIFVNKFSKDINTLHVTFLSKKPDQKDIDEMNPVLGNDEYFFTDNAIYLSCPNGYSNSKLTNNFFENKLKVKATTRNWKTVTEIMKIMSSYSK